MQTINGISWLDWKGMAPVAPLVVVYLPDQPHKAEASRRLFYVPLDIVDILCVRQ